MSRAEYQRAWRAANPGKQAEYSRRWAAKHPEQVRNQHLRLRQEVLSAYGGVCTCCSEAEEVFLEVDHINGDGADHREQLGNRHFASGAATYRWLKKHNFPEGFQLLCANCHRAKSRAVACPHKAGGQVNAMEQPARNQRMHDLHAEPRT